MASSLDANIQLDYNPLKGLLDKLEVNGWQSAFSYNSVGQEIERSLQGGITQESEYDKLGRLISQQIRGKEIVGKGFLTYPKRSLHKRTYRWDGDRLSSMHDDRTGEKRFQHDVYGNLSEVIYGDGSVEYRSSDLVGNLYQSKDMKDRQYEKGGRLVGKGQTKYKYDKLGNLIEKHESRNRVWKYDWDASGMLREVLRPDGNKVSFAYDALGRRLYKRFKQTTTHYVWDGNVPLHEYKEFDAKDATATDIITWVFEEGSFTPMAKIKGEKKYNILSDHLGTPIQAYNESGERIWERDLDSFGKARMQVGEAGFCNYLYQGQTYDSEIELAYNRFRYYDPTEGNYISRDPIGLEGGNPTLYGYVKDTNSWVDPFGLDSSIQDHHLISDKNVLTKNHPLISLAGYDKPDDFLQSAKNKMNLPTKYNTTDTESTIHSGRHFNRYSEQIADAMDRKILKGINEKWTQKQYSDALDDISGQLRDKLEKGEISLNKNKRQNSSCNFSIK